MRKIGIFGGTFNPIHNGHIHLMETVKKALSLDEVWLMPAYTPPHKETKDLAKAEDRLNMLALVCQGREGFSVCRYEVDKGGRSYTVETAQYLKSAYPQDQFYFLMGADMLLSFDQWYRYEEILSCFTLAAAARDQGEYGALYQKASQLPGKTEIVVINPMPVSSTQVRALAAAGKDFSGLVPEKVAAYIKEHGLYR